MARGKSAGKKDKKASQYQPELTAVKRVASRPTDGGISGVVWSVENTTVCRKTKYSVRAQKTLPVDVKLGWKNDTPAQR